MGGGGSVTGEGGKVTLSGKSNYTGATTIEPNGTLILAGGADTLSYNTSEDALVTVDGTLQAKNNGTAPTTYYRQTEGTGEIYVPADQTLVIGLTNHNGSSGLTNFTGTLRVAGTFDARNWKSGTTYTISGFDIVFEGTAGVIEQYNTNNKAVVEIASGKSLSGTGTISIPLTFADGAVVDARSETGTAYVTLSNKMTLPATGTVKVKANNYGIVLNATDLKVEKFALTDGGSLSEGVFSIVGDYLYVVQKPTVPTGTDSSAAEAIARAALQSGAFFMQVTEASAATGCLVDGAALFDNVVTFSAVGSSVTEATALVQYDFGVSDLTISTLQTTVDGGRLTVGTQYVLVCATVSNKSNLAQNTASYATGTALTLLNETTPLTGVVEPTPAEIAALRLTTPAGSRWLAVPMGTLFPENQKTGTMKLTVKASK